MLPALVVLFWLPFQLYPFAGVKSYFFIGILSLCALVFSLKKLVAENRTQFSLDRFDILLLVVVCGMSVTSMYGLDPALSFFSTLDRGVGVMLWIFSLVFIVVLKHIFRSDEQSIRYLDYGLVFAGTLVSILVWGATYSFFPEMFKSGLQGNSSLAGAVLLLIIPSFAVVLVTLSGQKKWWQMFGVLLLFLIIVTSPLFISRFSLGESRGVVIAIFVSLLLSVGFYLSLSIRKKISLIGKGILGSVLLICILCAGFLFKNESKVQIFFKEHSGSNRLIFWDTAFQAIHERPIFGYGNETFEYSFFNFFDPVSYRGREGWVDKPHNAFIEIIHDNGIIVFSLYVLCVAYCYFLLYKLGKDRKHLSESLIYFFVLSAYLFQNTLVFDGPTSVVLLSVLFARISYREKSEYVFNVRKWFFGVVVIASIFSLYWFSVRSFDEGNKMFLLAGLPIERLGEFSKPVFSTSKVGGVVSSAYLSNQIMNTIENDPYKMMKNYSNSIEMLAGAVLNEKNSDKSFPAQLFLARAYTYIYEKTEDESFIKKAQTYAKNAVSISRLNPEGYWVFAYAYALDGNENESLLASRIVIEIDPQLKEAYSRLVFLARKFGNLEVEKGTIEDAKKYFPDFDKPL